jgi:hypothetical protein
MTKEPTGLTTGQEKPSGFRRGIGRRDPMKDPIFHEPLHSTEPSRARPLACGSVDMTFLLIVLGIFADNLNMPFLDLLGNYIGFVRNIVLDLFNWVGGLFV